MNKPFKRLAFAGKATTVDKFGGEAQEGCGCCALSSCLADEDLYHYPGNTCEYGPLFWSFNVTSIICPGTSGYPGEGPGGIVNLWYRRGVWRSVETVTHNRYYWKLTIDGQDSKLELLFVNASGGEKLIVRYRMPWSRTFCCQCTNRMEMDDVCGPFDCQYIPTNVCLEPSAFVDPGDRVQGCGEIPNVIQYNLPATLTTGAGLKCAYLGGGRYRSEEFWIPGIYQPLTGGPDPDGWFFHFDIQFCQSNLDGTGTGWAVQIEGRLRDESGGNTGGRLNTGGFTGGWGHSYEALPLDPDGPFAFSVKLPCCVPSGPGGATPICGRNPFTETDCVPFGDPFATWGFWNQCVAPGPSGLGGFNCGAFTETFTE